MDTDLRDELERSFGDGPPIDDTATLLDRGHRALHRRRLASGGAAVAVAVVVVSASAVLGGGPSDSTGGPGPHIAPATQGPATPSATPQDTEAGLVRDSHLPSGVVVDLRADGVHVRAGARLPRTIDNPFHLDPPATSFAAVYVHGGQRYWYAGYIDKSGSGSAIMPVRAGMTFRDWVADQAPITGPGASSGSDSTGPWPGNPALTFVRFVGDTEQLRPVSDVTMIEQRAHPALPDSFATTADRSAVAEVEVEGVRWYVLARQLAGDPSPQLISVEATKGGATLDDFLELARQRYAEGGGGLL